MSKKLTDEQLERMLDSYYARRPERVFSARLATEKRSEYIMKRTLIKAAAVCACAALVGAGVFTYNTAPNDLPEVTSAQSESPKAEKTLPFAIKAYADDVTPDMIAGDESSSAAEAVTVKSSLSDEEYWINMEIGYSYPDSQAFKAKRLYPIYPDFGTQFTVNGDNIASVSVKSRRRGYIEYYRSSEIDSGKLRERQDLALDIPYSDDLIIFWHAPRFVLHDEAAALDQSEYLNLENSEKMEEARESMKEKLFSMNAQELTDIFGDTVKITVKYEDGTTKAMEALITLDEERNFVLTYSEINSDDAAVESADSAKPMTVNASESETCLYGDAIGGGIQVYTVPNSAQHYGEKMGINWLKPDEKAISEGRASATEDYPGVAYYGLQFNVTGDGIDYISVESEKGCKLRYDNDINEKDKYPDGTSSLEYIQYHANVIPEISWGAPQFAVYDKPYSKLEIRSDPSVAIEKGQEAVWNALSKMSAEEKTEYFGDTVNVKAYYKDGTVKTASIIITMDEDANLHAEIR